MAMPVVTAIPRVGAGATLENRKFDRRNVLEANRATFTKQPQFHGVNGRSKLLLADLHTKSARRVMALLAKDLIKNHGEVEKALSRESQRGKSGLFVKDLLSREDILKKREVLSKRECRNLRFLKKMHKERRRLYKCNLSSEHAVDLDLNRSLLPKFKKHLGTDMKDYKSATKAGDDENKQGEEEEEEAEEDNSSPGFEPGSDGNTGIHEKIGPSPDEVGPAKAALSNCATDALQSTSLEDDDERPFPTMDGAFDDHIRAQTKKRRLVDSPADLKSEKEQRKKAKKERKAEKEQAKKDKHQAATSTWENQSAQPNMSIRDRDADSTKKPAIDSMSQPKKLEAKVINIEETIVKDKNATNNESTVNVAKFNSDPASRPAVNGEVTNGDKVNTARTNGVEANVHSTNSVTTKGAKTNKSKLNTDIGLAVQPWYKTHARYIIEPDFDDLVYERRRKPKPKHTRRHKPYFISGAILN